MISETLLRQMMPNAGERLTPHLPFIGPAMEFGEINTPEDQCCFIAQVSHESGEYRYMEEIASGVAYEGRADLGNTQPGDGVKYKGHGAMQITGRTNHTNCGNALGIDLVNNPKLLTTPQWATHAAAWYWKYAVPPMNWYGDRVWFRLITYRVNGGYNGWEDRLQYLQRNLALMNLPGYSQRDEDQSIRAFQTSQGLVADGIVGQQTNAALMKQPRR